MQSRETAYLSRFHLGWLLLFVRLPIFKSLTPLLSNMTLRIATPATIAHLTHQGEIRRYRSTGIRGFNVLYTLSQSLTAMLHDPRVRGTRMVVDVLDACETGLRQMSRFYCSNHVYILQGK